MNTNTAELLKNEISAFRKGGKRYKDEYSNLKSIDDEKTIDAAVELAYHDAQRTMRGISKSDEDQKKKRNALNQIKLELFKYFTCSKEPTIDQASKFDEKHKELCDIWCNEFNNDFGTYGKAQKIINMSFKYLFCCDDAPGMVENSKYKEHFEYCHMPLDSFTLIWYKRNVDKEKKDYTWSKINYEEYIGIQKNIRDYLNESEDELSPLQKEFIVWSQK